MSNYENIIYEKKSPIAYITLNRPEKLNALSMPLQLELREALWDAGWDDNEIRVIVIKGAGRAFSAGFDISEPRNRDSVQYRAALLKGKGLDGTAFWDVFWDNPKPLIAQVHSFCIAGGMAIVSFCDLCICTEDSLFGYPFIRDGGPYIPAVWPWILGMKRAKELLLTGNLIDAQEAWRLGLVNKVVPNDLLEEEVNRMARTVAKVPAINNEFSKRLVNMAYDQANIRAVMERSGELEAMSLTASAESNPERAEFQRLVGEMGLKAALEWRSSRFVEEDRWWKERKSKSGR